MQWSTAASAALDYLARGWSVIPVRRKDKRPVIPWQAYQGRRPSMEAVAAWFSRWPEANVGIVTGTVSALVVLDIDPAHGGVESLERWQTLHGMLPPTLESLTGGGGRHLYFAHPGEPCPSRVGLLPGLDLRGDGGYVVAPPSVHPSGRAYRWREGHEPGRISPARLPRALLAVGDSSRAGHTLAYWRQLLRDGVVEGERNSAVASISGHLLWHGVDPQVVGELMLCWNRVRCRPPLSDEEVVRTVESITRLHEAPDRR